MRQNSSSFNDLMLDTPQGRVLIGRMETQPTSAVPNYKSIKMDDDTNMKVKTIADKFYEGNISMAFREAIRRMFRAEFESKSTTQ